MRRFIAAFLAVCLAFSANTFAFASNLDEIRQKIEEAKSDNESETTDNTGSSSENSGSGESFGTIPPFLHATDYLHRVFSDIMDLYVKDHLYDFTREELLEKFLYDMIDKHPELYETMLNAMLGTMDKYSSYHEKSSGYLSLESQSAGYGIVVADTDSGIKIQKVLSQSEAEKAGLLSGDIVVGVCGYDVSSLPWYAVSEMLRRPYLFVSEKGENGKYPDYNPQISIKVSRDGEILDFNLAKGLIITDELSFSYTESDGKDIAYIEISSFVASDLDERFYAAVKKAHDDGYTNLTIDLRNNGGGSLDLAVNMAEIFVDDGDVMFYFSNKDLDEPLAVTSDTPKIPFDSISILINEHTASAAELMASILKNKAGAVLVGNKSYGKAVGQNVYTLNTGDYITITTYEIFDANMESYNNIGLEPELVLDNVEMAYILPELEIFNHVNYKEISEGVYSDACLALEQRLNVLGFMKDEYVDGIWDGVTELAVIVLQTDYLGSLGSGVLDDKTVTLITDLINNMKDDTYYEDSQLDAALLYHAALDQARRLVKEKERLAKKQKAIIEDNKAKLEAYYAEQDALLDD